MVKLKDGREVYGVIYKITNKVNGKVYIGQTTRKRGFNGRYETVGTGIERVLNYHLQRKSKGINYNQYLVNSIMKYGIKKWNIDEVLDIAGSEIELNKKEEYYIMKFNSIDRKYGYNSTLGGDNNTRNNSVKNKLKFKTGIPLKCKETKEVFLSIKDLADKLGLKHSAYIGKRVKEGGSYVNKKKIYEMCKPNDYTKAVFCKTDEKAFYNARQASEEYKVSKKAILDCCNGKHEGLGRKGKPKSEWCYLYKMYDCFMQ